ncbi:MAG: GerMN domain-containing protein [Nitrospirota bacterium]
MKKTHRIKKNSRRLRYLLAVLLIFVISAAASYFYFKPRLAFKSSFIENIESHLPGTKPPAGEKNSQRLYNSQSESAAEDNRQTAPDSTLVTAENTIKKYMEPYGTKLLDLYMDKDGTVYVDFSNELKKKFTGDAYDEYRIVADLYENIRINVPGFNALKILIDGKEAASIGGHIDISRPIGKEIEDVEQGKTDRNF